MGLLDYMDNVGISLSFINSKKSGGTINYLNLMKNGK
jgi:hypothetical protein